MAQPVLVKAYIRRKESTTQDARPDEAVQSLPPVSSFAFTNILQAVDSSAFQSAIDGIADICAKNRMSLSDEYASHLPPLGEITAATPKRLKPRLIRPGMRTALTSVPEASSGSSESSRRSNARSKILSFGRKKSMDIAPSQHVRVGLIGSSIQAGSTTAMAFDLWQNPIGSALVTAAVPTLIPPRETAGDARFSLQQLLNRITGRH